MDVSRKHDNRWLLRRCVPYFRPHAATMALDLFCASLTTICDLVLPLIMRYITGTALNNGQLLLSTVLRIGAIYTLLRIIDAAANYYMQSIGHIMGSKIEADMRRDLFDHLQMLSHSYYDNARIGQLMSCLTTDLNDITEFAHHFPEEMFIAILKITISFIILAQINLLLTIAIFVSIPLMVFCSRFFSQKMRAAFKDSRKQLGALNASVEDSLSGIRVVKSFANEDIENAKFAKSNQRFLEIKKRMYRSMAGFHSVPRLFDGLMYIICVVLGSAAMIRGSIQASDLVAYLLYVTMLLTAIRRMIEFTEQFQRGITGIERFVEVLDEPVEICDKADAVDLVNVRGDIQFQNVTFSYTDGGSNVLAGIDLHITPGMNIALVGPSGSGKSTMCSLIPRFYDVTDGAILVDGIDVRDIHLKSLRSQIGAVQQDVYLFAGSIAENIEYGKPGASRREIERAARLAGAHDFISQMEQGYDTYCGEHGVRLSGGQKQRIAIARVFLKDPPILILDEATSALDNESERLVQQSINRLMEGRTTFSIAHRLTSIRGADLILVLTDNGIEEQGTHRELMARQGLYAELYRMYNDETPLAAPSL